MTPYELAKLIHRDLSPVVPKLSAALNRALVEIGEGSILVGFGQGTHREDNVSFQDAERISLEGREPAAIIARIREALSKLEENSAWKVFIDRKPTSDPTKLELLYTLVRSRDF